jgi:fused signal recognition particle receptor
MEFVLILGILLVVAVLATGIALATSRRSLRRQEEAERAAVDQAPSAPAVSQPEAEPRVAPGPGLEIVLEPEPEIVLEPEAEAEPEELVRPRLRDRLGKARALLAGYVGDLRSRERIDDDTWDELEEALILADVGVGPTQAILDDLRRRVKETGASTAEALLELLKTDLVEQMGGADRSLAFRPGEMNVWMFVGVNGVGKTTTIGKIGQQEINAGRSVVMAAADTFRAAAAEQLQLWSKRVGADLVRGQEGADPGSVVFDAMGAAQSRGADLVLVDTAGRLHTKVNLMEELKKLRRIVDRSPGALKEVLLVIDATTGQNGLTQAKQFGEAVDVTGVVLTKLDGTAKGGIVIAVQSELGIPVKLVGVGETAADLIPFDPEEFVDALFSDGA